MKLFLGLLAIALAFIGYIPYFHDIYRGRTKPHAFSWLVWGILTAIAFVAQLTGKGGAGSWVTGVTALVCFVITVIALRVGRQNIVLVDWLFLAAAIGALIPWLLTNNPTTSVILVTLIDAIAFVPTFRKSYHQPYEETVITYWFSALKFALALVALEHFSLVTALYPLSLVISNGLFAMMVHARRKVILG